MPLSFWSLGKENQTPTYPVYCRFCTHRPADWSTVALPDFRWSRRLVQPTFILSNLFYCSVGRWLVGAIMSSYLGAESLIWKMTNVLRKHINQNSKWNFSIQFQINKASTVARIQQEILLKVGRDTLQRLVVLPRIQIAGRSKSGF